MVQGSTVYQRAQERQVDEDKEQPEWEEKVHR
jgi:hypothetical protein